MKIVLLTLMGILIAQMAMAQAHNMGGNYNCKLKKGNFFNSEKQLCPACETNDLNEKTAKAKEDNRRTEQQAADLKAKQAAEQLAAEQNRIEKIRLAEIEKAKEAAEQKARNEMLARYKDIAAKGQINSTLKGDSVSLTLDHELIKPFTDYKRKIYGFKAGEKEVLSFPYEGHYTNILRLEGSDYFQVMVSIADGSYYGTFSYAYLVNHLGEKIKIEGLSAFDYPIGVWENTFYLFKNLSTPELCDNSYCYKGNPSFIVFFDSKEAASAKLKTMIYRGGGLFMCQKFSYCHVARYKVDFNCVILEKTEGYQLREIKR